MPANLLPFSALRVPPAVRGCGGLWRDWCRSGALEGALGNEPQLPGPPGRGAVLFVCCCNQVCARNMYVLRTLLCSGGNTLVCMCHSRMDLLLQCVVCRTFSSQGGVDESSAPL